MIFYKNDYEIDKMKKAGQLTKHILDCLKTVIVPGTTTGEIDACVFDLTIKNGGIPAPLGYKKFPKSCCTSVNSVICHGIPSYTETLKEGDIINVDVTTIVDGWHGDSSRMYCVGECSEQAIRLVETTKECLELGINTVKIGSDIRDIAETISKYAKSKGYSLVQQYGGHGIGRIFHEEPPIPHDIDEAYFFLIKPGLVFTIEPMLNIGSKEYKLLDDKWTVVTADGSLSAQFEHTIAVRSNGIVEVLTK